MIKDNIGLAVNGFVPSLCPKDNSHGRLDFVYANGERWECFTCGTYGDKKGVVFKDLKQCDVMKGGLINNG